MYDHHIKAGNPGDVVKHVALIAAADAIMANCRGSFRYADTFAGYAWNPLSSGGEWQYGIGKVHDAITASANPAIQFWRELWACRYGLEGSLYPGTTLFVRNLSLKHGLAFRPRLWDISPAVIAQLMTVYGNGATIFPRPAHPDDFTGEASDLLLIDPPGHEPDSPYLGNLPDYFAVARNVLLWLPVTTVNGVETVASREAHRECCKMGVPVVTVMWGGEKGTRGCRLAFQLSADVAQTMQAAVSEIAGIAQWEIVS